MHTKCLGIHFLTWKKRLSNVYHKRHHFSFSIQDDKWARVKYSKEKQKLTEIKKIIIATYTQAQETPLFLG